MTREWVGRVLMVLRLRSVRNSGSRGPAPPAEASGALLQMPRRTWEKHVQVGSIQLVRGRYPVLVNPQLHYSDRTGFALDENLEPFLGH